MFTLQVSGLEDGEYVKSFMKENVSEVYMDSTGGYALGGKWTNYIDSLGDRVFNPGDGMAVLGVTIMKETSHVRTTVDKVVFLINVKNTRPNSMTTYNHSFLTQNKAIRIRVDGPFTAAEVRGSLSLKVDKHELVFRIPGLQEHRLYDPFYWAAAVLLSNGTAKNMGENPALGGAKDVAGLAPTKAPLGPIANDLPFIEQVSSAPNLHKLTHVKNKKGKKVKLPEGVSLAQDINGIALLSYDHDGAPSLGLADALLATKETLSPDLLDWIMEQSKEYQVLAESLKIIALANTKEKGDNMT